MAVDGITATYIAANQFSVVGNQTADFHGGRRVKAALTGGNVYSTISGSVFGAVTTVTLFDSELDNTLTKVWYGTGIGSFGSLPDHAHDSSEGSGGELTISGAGGDYLARDGSTPLTGDWDFGSQTISGTGDIWCNDLHTAGASLYIGDVQLTSASNVLDFGTNTVSGTGDMAAGRLGLGNVVDLAEQDSKFWVITEDVGWGAFYKYSDDAGGSAPSMYKARGTYAVPAAVQASDVVGGYNAFAHDGTQHDQIGKLRHLVESIGAGNVKSYIEFHVSDSSGVLQEMARINSTGLIVGDGVDQQADYPLHVLDSWAVMSLDGDGASAVAGILFDKQNNTQWYMYNDGANNDTFILESDSVNMYSIAIGRTYGDIGIGFKGPNLPDSSTRLSIIADESSGVGTLNMYQHSDDSGGSAFSGYSSRGADQVNPTAVVASDVITGYNAWAHDGTVFDMVGRCRHIVESISVGDVASYWELHTSDTSGSSREVVRINSAGALMVGGDFTNANMTIGVTIDQADNDDEILAFKSSDVGHGITDYGETDTFGSFHKIGNSEGGIKYRGFGEDDRANMWQSFYTNDNTTKSTAARAPTAITTYKKDGTGIQTPGTNANLFAIMGWDGAANKAVWIADFEGDTWQTGGATIGNTSSTISGTLRWTGSDFEGYDGSQWLTLTASGGGGVTDHSDLNELDYASAAHTGFVSIATTQTITGLKTFSQDVTINADLTAVSGTFDYVEITDSISEIQFTSASGIIGVAGDEDLLLLSAEQLTIQGQNASQIVFSTSSGTIGVSTNEDVLTFYDGGVIIEGNNDGSIEFSTASGTIGVAAHPDLLTLTSGIVFFDGHIRTTVSGAYDIGEAAYPFRDIYLTGGSVYLNDEKISSPSPGVIDFGGATLENVTVSGGGGGSSIWTQVGNDAYYSDGNVVVSGTTPDLIVKATGEYGRIQINNNEQDWYIVNDGNNWFKIYNNNASKSIFKIAPGAGLENNLTINNGLVLIGDSANANMTHGLTINQAANDDQILALKSSDIAHGITGITETDTYFYAKKLNADSGGAALVGLSEINLGLIFGGILTTDDTTKTTGSHGAIILDGAKKSGTGTTSIGTDGNIVAMKNNWSTCWILDAEGDTWQTGDLTIENAGTPRILVHTTADSSAGVNFQNDGHLWATGINSSGADDNYYIYSSTGDVYPIRCYHDGSVTFGGDILFGANTISGTGDIYCNDIYTASGTVYIGDEQISSTAPGVIDFGGAEITNTTTYQKGRQELIIEYATTSGIDILPGRIDIEDGSDEYALSVSGTLFKDSLSLSADTWYYVYAKPPAVGNVLSESEIELSTTEPTRDVAKRGHYHGSNTDWRCFSALYSDVNSEVKPFMQIGDEWKVTGSIINQDVAAFSSTSWTDATFTLPFGETYAIIDSRASYGDVYSHLRYKKKGVSGDVYTTIATVRVDNTRAYGEYHLPIDSDKKGEIKWSDAGTQLAYLNSEGFVLPDWIAPK